MQALTDLALKAALEEVSSLVSVAVFATEDTAFYKATKATNKRVDLPFIAFHESVPVIDFERFDWAGVREGLDEAIDDDGNLTVNRTMPITIPYDIIIFANKLQELQQIQKDIIFWIFRTGTIGFTYGNEGETFTAEIMRFNTYDSSGSPAFAMGEIWKRGSFYISKINIDIKTFLVDSELVKAFTKLNVRVFDGIYTSEESKILEYSIALASLP